MQRWSQPQERATDPKINCDLSASDQSNVLENDPDFGTNGLSFSKNGLTVNDDKGCLMWSLFAIFYLIEIWNAVVLVLSTYIFFGTVHFHHAVVAADYKVGLGTQHNWMGRLVKNIITDTLWSQFPLSGFFLSSVWSLEFLGFAFLHSGPKVDVEGTLPLLISNSSSYSLFVLPTLSVRPFVPSTSASISSYNNKPVFNLDPCRKPQTCYFCAKSEL